MRSLPAVVLGLVLLSVACGGTKAGPSGTLAPSPTPTQLAPFDAWIAFPAGTKLLSRNPFSSTVRIQQVEVLIPGVAPADASTLADRGLKQNGWQPIDTSPNGSDQISLTYRKGGDFITMKAFASGPDTILSLLLNPETKS